MEEDEQEMVDFLSTRTSNVASSLGPNRSPDLSPANTAGRFRRQLPNQQSPFKIVEMHPAQKLPDDMSIGKNRNLTNLMKLFSIRELSCHPEYN
jgi:hypothetical protein